MRKTPKKTVAIAEPNPHERLIGLLGAMKDGMVEQFDHQGVEVYRDGASIYVRDSQTGYEVGGRLLLESADLNEAAEWIENKAELYN